MATQATTNFGQGGHYMDAQSFLNSMHFLGTNLDPQLVQHLWGPMQQFAALIRSFSQAPQAESSAAVLGGEILAARVEERIEAGEAREEQAAATENEEEAAAAGREEAMSPAPLTGQRAVDAGTEGSAEKRGRREEAAEASQASTAGGGLPSG